MGDEPERRPRQKYWGLRTLGFLTIALAALLTSSSLADDGRGGAAITLLGMLVGLSGAAYCSFRGLRDFNWLPR